MSTDIPFTPTRLRENTPLFEALAPAFSGGGAEGNTRFSLAHPFPQATETEAA
ncbi:MAG TPA: hypothetical protein VLA61_01745 [Ideonella sp.]|uniref:hypothetical protein n=1 Tax=Ideonella sp. TaxID=1929293 RepID=UPI002D1BC30C|nr:hypothetical protein [Ideonella sp.]HSI46973.1 hypothetical protein [Ideonella sp.]